MDRVLKHHTNGGTGLQTARTSLAQLLGSTKHLMMFRWFR
jgi:hypothetical protein